LRFLVDDSPVYYDDDNDNEVDEAMVSDTQGDNILILFAAHIQHVSTESSSLTVARRIQTHLSSPFLNIV